MDRFKKEEVKLHLIDGIKGCRGMLDIKQIEYNLFEIADHLEIEINNKDLEKTKEV